MGQQEVYEVLKKEKKWMDANEIREKSKIKNISPVLMRLRKHGDVLFKQVRMQTNKGLFPKYIYKFKD